MLRISTGKKAKAKRQAGFVVTAELLLITTILGLGLLTGYTKVRDQVLAELSDTGSAIGSLNQSYSISGTVWTTSANPLPFIAETSGFAFADAADVASGLNDVGGDAGYIRYAGDPIPSTSLSGVGEVGHQ